MVVSGAVMGGAYTHVRENPQEWEKSKLGLTRSAGELGDTLVYIELRAADESFARDDGAKGDTEGTDGL